MLSNATREIIERFWATELGCPIEALRQPGISVVPRYQRGAFFLQIGHSLVFSVPELSMKRVEETVELTSAMECFDAAGIAELLGPSVTLILGPCPIGYLESTMLRVPEESTARRLMPKDAGAVEQLSAECGREAWEHGGVEFGVHEAVFGAFTDVRLVAAASFERWGNVIAHVGVVTAPGHRGMGFGKATAAAATQHALGVGLLPQWRTLASNHTAISVGKALGFEMVATHYFARM